MHGYDEAFLRRAIEISARALELPGTEPFGAVVVRDGRIVGEGINRSLANLDPTSHGETEAIRDAERAGLAGGIEVAAREIDGAEVARRVADSLGLAVRRGIEVGE